MGLVEVGINSENDRKSNYTEHQKLRKKGCSDSENKLLEHPPIAQLVERRTVEVVDILRSLVRTGSAESFVIERRCWKITSNFNAYTLTAGIHQFWVWKT